MNAGFGAAMAVSAIGGGLPALIIAGALWVGQFGVNLHANHVARQAALTHVFAAPNRNA